MISRFFWKKLDWVLIVIGLVVVTLDSILPSWLTGPMDELAMLGLLVSMKFVNKMQN